MTDFMLVVDTEDDDPAVQALYRRVSCTDGTVDLEVEFAPQFDYARSETTVEAIEDGVIATGDNERVVLSGPCELTVDTDRASASYPLAEDETHWFVLHYSTQTPTERDACEKLLAETATYWREWVHSCDRSGCLFSGVDHDQVVRSELLLKLLTYRASGAITAAPTTSLPENIGGVRNWDYHYSWIRDGARTLRAFGHLGHMKEVHSYLDRFLQLSQAADPSELQPCYRVTGDGDLSEETLDHLTGYRDSAPVRIGNDATSQLQLDIYGELVVAIAQLIELDEESEIVVDEWDAIRTIAESACERWDEPDAGIWELKSGPKHLVYSKVMCWAAIDQAIKLATTQGFDASIAEWEDHKEQIKDVVIEQGFSNERGSFVQAFDKEILDAAVLLLPLNGFLPVDDERIQATIDTVMDELMVDNGLVYRYEDDTLPGDEGAFVMCSFWLVDTLALSGRTDEAREIFETLMEQTSPLGLLAEEIDPETGEYRGNYPQAFSHIGLINSALHLTEAETDELDVEPFGMVSGT